MRNAGILTAPEPCDTGVSVVALSDGDVLCEPKSARRGAAVPRRRLASVARDDAKRRSSSSNSRQLRGVVRAIDGLRGSMSQSRATLSLDVRSAAPHFTGVRYDSISLEM